MGGDDIDIKEMEKTIGEQQEKIKELESILTKLSIIVCRKHDPKIGELVKKMTEFKKMDDSINQIVKNTNTIIEAFDQEKEEGKNKQEHYIG